MLDGLALIVLFLALPDGDREFNMAAAGEQLRRDDGTAVLLLAVQLQNLFPSGEEANIPSSFRTERQIVQPELRPPLMIANCNKSALQLGVMVPDLANFRARQAQAANQFITQGIIIPGAAVKSNRILLVGFLTFFRHIYNLYYNRYEALTRGKLGKNEDFSRRNRGRVFIIWNSCLATAPFDEITNHFLHAGKRHSQEIGTVNYENAIIRLVELQVFFREANGFVNPAAHGVTLYG